MRKKKKKKMKVRRVVDEATGFIVPDPAQTQETYQAPVGLNNQPEEDDGIDWDDFFHGEGGPSLLYGGEVTEVPMLADMLSLGDDDDEDYHAFAGYTQDDFTNYDINTSPYDMQLALQYFNNLPGVDETEAYDMFCADMTRRANSGEISLPGFGPEPVDYQNEDEEENYVPPTPIPISETHTIKVVGNPDHFKQTWEERWCVNDEWPNGEPPEQFFADMDHEELAFGPGYDSVPKRLPRWVVATLEENKEIWDRANPQISTGGPGTSRKFDPVNNPGMKVEEMAERAGIAEEQHMLNRSYTSELDTLEFQESHPEESHQRWRELAYLRRKEIENDMIEMCYSNVGMIKNNYLDNLKSEEDEMRKFRKLQETTPGALQGVQNVIPNGYITGIPTANTGAPTPGAITAPPYPGAPGVNQSGANNYYNAPGGNYNGAPMGTIQPLEQPTQSAWITAAQMTANNQPATTQVAYPQNPPGYGMPVPPFNGPNNMNQAPTGGMFSQNGYNPKMIPPNQVGQRGGVVLDPQEMKAMFVILKRAGALNLVSQNAQASQAYNNLLATLEGNVYHLTFDQWLNFYKAFVVFVEYVNANMRISPEWDSWMGKLGHGPQVHQAAPGNPWAGVGQTPASPNPVTNAINASNPWGPAQAAPVTNMAGPAPGFIQAPVAPQMPLNMGAPMGMTQVQGTRPIFAGPLNGLQAGNKQIDWTTLDKHISEIYANRALCSKMNDDTWMILLDIVKCVSIKDAAKVKNMFNAFVVGLQSNGLISVLAQKLKEMQVIIAPEDIKTPTGGSYSRDYSSFTSPSVNISVSNTNTATNNMNTAVGGGSAIVDGNIMKSVNNLGMAHNITYQAADLNTGHQSTAYTGNDEYIGGISHIASMEHKIKEDQIRAEMELAQSQGKERQSEGGMI